jgi:hypothetical protein
MECQIKEILETRAALSLAVNAVLDNRFDFNNNERIRVGQVARLVSDDLGVVLSNALGAAIRDAVLVRGARRIRYQGGDCYRGVALKDMANEC